MTRNPFVLAAILLLLSVVSCKKDPADFEENKKPVAEAGSPKTVTLPDSVVVTGSGTDADGQVVAYAWSQIAGPNNATIVNPGAASSVIKFTVQGSYMFQLIVTDDDGAFGIDTVSVFVNGPNNKAPIANAGVTKTVSMYDAAAFLIGSGTDDDGKVETYLWSQFSGPANAAIETPGKSSTTIKFTVAGTYVFQLKVVDDKGATGVDTATVLVKPDPGPITLTLQPANNPDEYIVAVEDGVDKSVAPTYDLPIQTWTRNGKLYTVRSLIKFDISSIPANAIEIDAKLYLYSYPSPTLSGDLVNPNYNQPYNSLSVEGATANWSPATVTWSNQPSPSGWGTQTGGIPFPQDVVIPVTSVIANSIHTNTNYGFMIKLTDETPFNASRILVSSHNPNPGFAAKFPKLVVTYR